MRPWTRTEIEGDPLAPILADVAAVSRLDPRAIELLESRRGVTLMVLAARLAAIAQGLERSAAPRDPDLVPVIRSLRALSRMSFEASR